MSDSETKDGGLIGTVWRDTYGDKRARNRRTVRVVERTADGRWKTKTLTHSDGRPAVDGERRLFSTVSEKTLFGHYERVKVLS